MAFGEPDLGEFGLREIEGVTWICHGFTPLMSGEALQLPGRHNLSNVLAALALGSALGLPPSDLLEGAKDYRGFPSLPAGDTGRWRAVYR